VGGKQRYKCMACGRQFLATDRIDTAILWSEYTVGKQTYSQLALKYNCSRKTIQRKIDLVSAGRDTHFECAVNVLMDTTYFGRKFGVMVLKDSISGQFLYKMYVKNETNKLYLSCIEEIARRGISVQSIICDGRKGLFRLFGSVPVQMCQFHQVQIITKYLTRKPKVPAAIELRALALQLVKKDKVGFTDALNQWYNKWEKFLKERTKSTTNGKSHYTHKRLRSAYLSLKNNLPWLFTFEDYKELMIPNTTNGLDGSFADLKNKLRCHNGLAIARKKKFIDEFFKA
jgi:hypothetical protein